MWPVFSTQISCHTMKSLLSYLEENIHDVAWKETADIRYNHLWKEKKVIIGYFCEVTWKGEEKGVTLCMDPWSFSGSHSISSDKLPSVSELFQKSKSNPRTFCYIQNGSPYPVFGFVRCAKRHTRSLAKFFSKLSKLPKNKLYTFLN